MTILGVDPGSARLGWGVIKVDRGEQEVVKFGCLETKKPLPDSARLEILYNQFSKLLLKFKPEAVAVEDLFFGTNSTTIVKVGQARGIVLLASAQRKLAVVSYTPPQIKLAVTGYGKADKRQVQLMTKSILGLESLPRPDDAADALAVALTHAFSYKLTDKVK
jgi:crossover junction endodeoxyribonuclease RuvC